MANYNERARLWELSRLSLLMVHLSGSRVEIGEKPNSAHWMCLVLIEGCHRACSYYQVAYNVGRLESSILVLVSKNQTGTGSDFWNQNWVLKPDLVLENPTQNQFWNWNQNFWKSFFLEKKSLELRVNQELVGNLRPRTQTRSDFQNQNWIIFFKNQTWCSIYLWNWNWNHSNFFKEPEPEVFHKSQELPNSNNFFPND